MAPHDAYARITPYELLFPAPGFPGERFPPVEAEAAARGTDLANPAAFAMCGAVQGILADLRPDDEAPGHGRSREPEQVSAHAHVLYFAFHMWRTQRGPGTERAPPAAHSSETPGSPSRAPVPSLALLSRATLRALPSSGPLKPGWEAALQGRAGYLQLAQHMVWAEEQGADRPDSVDGFFWAATQHGAFHAAAVTGMRAGRPGYGVVPLPSQPLNSLSEWTMSAASEDGDDFATRLPGAEIDGLLGMRTPAEALKLLAFALRRWTTNERAPVVEGAPPPADSAESLSPPPTPASESASPGARSEAARAPSLPTPSTLSHVVL